MRNTDIAQLQKAVLQNEVIPLDAYPPISLDLFIRQSGLSPATCWRYRKKGWLRTIIIAGRHYVTRQAIVEFNERAARGEFAGTLANPYAATKAANAEEEQ